MEFETSSDNHQPKVAQQLLSAALPVLFIAISYVDPGKWAAAVEGGARFGCDLVFPVLIFNFAAIFCHYMSARIAVVTGKDLAQICSEEYDNFTCIFLGAQAEVSMIVLDLMMVLGTAYGLNILVGIDLFTGVFLTALNAALFPFLSMLLENGRVKFLSIGFSVFILLFYFCGVFSTQSAPLSMDGTLTRLSGESAFALMSLLGAHIMPHNLYLHSSIVQQDKQSTNVPKGALCYEHLFAIICAFSGIFVVNYLLMNSAANVFYTTGLLNFQDALSLLDQVFRSSVAPMALIMLIVFSNQITALSWNLGGPVVVSAFFKMDIPGWLHHATIRIVAIIPALCSVWNSGAEGMYQMLIFTQVVVALLLPSSVIPLFRVASSRTIMGIYKTSRFEEFLVLITFVGMLALKVIFFIELMFGNSDWVTNLRWNTGSSVPIAYVFLVCAASVSFCLMLWLAATPLKSATSRIDTQVLEWDIQTSMPETFVEGEQKDENVSKYAVEKPGERQERPLVLEQPLGHFPDLSATSANFNLPDTLYESEDVFHATSSENKSEIINSSSSVCREEVLAADGDANSDTTNLGEVSDSESQNAHTLKRETVEVVEKTLRMEGALQNMRDDGESLEPEEPTKGISETNQSLTSEGPGSFRSPGGKNDDAGSGTGSLSRLAGLGRAARRQLTVVLDEFWGQLFDFHGQVTTDAKTKKLDLLLGLNFKEDLKSSSASIQLDSNRKDPAGYFPSVAGMGTDPLINSASALYGSPKQQVQSMLESSYGVQRGSSTLWSPPQTRLLETYLQSSSANVLDSSERRYSSVRIPASSDGCDQQPATIHGYQLRSYLNRAIQDRGSGFLNGQIESLAPKTTSSVMPNYGDSFARPVVRKTPNGISAFKPPGFHNTPIARNSSLQPDRPSYELSSPKPAENVNPSVTEKKYYSLPDVSGLRIPHQDASLLDTRGQWNDPMAYGQKFDSSTYERFQSSVPSRSGAPSGINEVSPKVYRDAFSRMSSTPSNALWYRQPFEQFGVADKSPSKPNTQETASSVDLEVKLLQSFRYCIMKLLKLEGSDWLFRQNDGADEDLIDRVGAREKFLDEAESVPVNRPNNASLSQFYSEADHTKFLVTSVPHCGEGCVYKVPLIISFGVWCIHRILELSHMESRPELWGKYTYILNRLQGIIELAFFKPRSPMAPCFCLQLPDGWQPKSSPPILNGGLPPQSKQGRGKCTTASTLLDTIKGVEMAISCRKGRTGTAAGDVAFPKGKGNLASVLKRYKRRLSNKSMGSQDSGPPLRKVSSSLHYGS